MSVAKITEIKVSSPKSFDDAIQEGITRANKTLKNVKSAWVKDFEVTIDNKGQIAEYRILLKITFILEDLIIKISL
jgi:flavin-binding protein dodecin